MSRTPPVRRPFGDGHPLHPPRRPVADCQGTQRVARCRGPRCRHTPCREPTRPLASWPFSQLCRLACQVAIVAYDRRRTIEPRGSEYSLLGELSSTRVVLVREAERCDVSLCGSVHSYWFMDVHRLTLFDGDQCYDIP